ncbi:ATP-binding protein [uncultured Aureimonas sp.]|uniref:ATP-binding protein n=1 Tax=uncultured Aureimonas sp. TaxID=1604662 RepID=UPI0025EBF11C|nr:ATP-binding protein [uncultured Aureimonas sp.]
MSKTDPLTPSRKSEAFLDRIRSNQNEKRRSVAQIMGDVLSVHLPTAYDADLNDQLDWLLDSMLLELECRNGAATPRGMIRGGRVLVVTGEAGAGKSAAIDHALRNRPEFAGYGIEGAWSPVDSVVAPSPFTLGALGNAIVRRSGYEGRRDIQHSKVWPVVRELLKERGVRILHIDEAQHGDEIVNQVAFREVENTLKRMLQEEDWLVWLILSGLPELARFCQDDKSMKRRVRVLRFEPLRFPDHVETIRDTARRIGEACPSVNCTTVMTDEFANRLLHAAMRQFGILVEYIQDAIGECLTAGESALSAVHFADVYSLRTGELDDDMNVFLSRNWASISVETSLYEEVVDDEGSVLGGRKLKGRRTRGVHR